MRYYLGPWQWKTDGNDSFFAPPSGAIGAIDLGTIPEMSVAGSPRKGCLCWTNGSVLGSDYDLLANGDVREIRRTGKIASTIARTMGSVPVGDLLHEMILDCFIGASDTDGDTAPMPIVPGIDGWMDLHLSGHGRVKGARFEWGRTPHTAKLRHVLRKEFATLFADSQSGKLKDNLHHRRVLDDWCIKFGVSEWREFVPDGIQSDIPGRVPRETTLTDNFNRADAGSLGTASGGFTWSTPTGSYSIVSNQARYGGTANSMGRADSDLSSSDHYTDVTIDSSSTNQGACARCSSSVETYYYFRRSSSSNTELFKRITGTLTNIGSAANSASLPHALRTSCNGSSIAVSVAGSVVTTVTDTAIASNLRGGFRATGGTSSNFDDFTAADLGGGGGGIIYTQLEHGTRGIERGTFHKY